MDHSHAGAPVAKMRSLTFAHLGISDCWTKFRASTMATLRAGLKLHPGALGLSGGAPKLRWPGRSASSKVRNAICDCAAHLEIFRLVLKTQIAALKHDQSYSCARPVL